LEELPHQSLDLVGSGEEEVVRNAVQHLDAGARSGPLEPQGRWKRRTREW
jgi:hypothetical protein